MREQRVLIAGAATVALFDGGRLAVGHVGDSRGYLLRDGELSQLTNDHTFVQNLLDDIRHAEILSGGTPEFAAIELVRASLDTGSSDNVTCVVADVVSAEESLPAPNLWRI